jgi:hypothetical protein
LISNLVKGWPSCTPLIFYLGIILMIWPTNEYILITIMELNTLPFYTTNFTLKWHKTTLSWCSNICNQLLLSRCSASISEKVTKWLCLQFYKLLVSDVFIRTIVMSAHAQLLWPYIPSLECLTGMFALIPIKTCSNDNELSDFH